MAVYIQHMLKYGSNSPSACFVSDLKVRLSKIALSEHFKFYVFPLKMRQAAKDYVEKGNLISCRRVEGIVIVEQYTLNQSRSVFGKKKNSPLTILVLLFKILCASGCTK